MNHTTSISTLAALLAGATASAAEIRVDGLSSRAPDRVLVFVVRGEGVATPVIAFQERTRQSIESHMHARVISMEEAFVRGGAELQKQLAECRGDDRCYARLVGAVDARFLVVVAVSPVSDETVVGTRFIDLDETSVLGKSVDTVSAGVDPLTVVEDTLRAAVPRDLWDPYGKLTVDVATPGAEVIINDRTVGVTPMRTIVGLLPGTYRVLVQKRDYEPASAQVEVSRGQETETQLTLAPTSDSGWVLWVVLGAAAVAGAATAAAFALSGKDDLTFCSSPDPSACQ